ncbi:MAG: Jag N-terminal domain-containing protein [Erysipelotrichaceae bacterium]|jgi:spoIIIJ-associated protein|nr:Jag N-terminal domain-containing protein [Erysipelotrichaceae bacterium]
MKKVYLGKTLDDAIAAAAHEKGIDVSEVIYLQLEDKKGFLGLSSKAQIEVYEMEDVLKYLELYLTRIIEAYGIGIELVSASYEHEVINVDIDTVHNSVLIGAHGDTLKALNDVARHALNATFHRHFRVLLNVSDYKFRRYNKIINLAKKLAGEVVKTKTDISLDGMSSDERRVIHNELSTMEHIKTESTGQGKERHIVIKYVE